METDLKNIKNILDEAILAEKRCYELIGSLLCEENKQFQSPILAKIAIIIEKMPNTPPTETLKELGKFNG